MAISFDTSSSTSGHPLATPSLTMTFGSGTNQLVVAAFFYRDTVLNGADRVSAATVAGNAMSNLGYLGTNNNSNDYSISVWGYAGIVNGSQTITPTMSGQQSFDGIIGASYFGCKQTGVPDAVSTNIITGSNTLAANITTISNNDWTLLFVTNNGPQNAATGSTLRQNIGPFFAGGLFDSNGPITPAGSTTMNLNQGGGTTPWQYVMLGIAPTATPATGSFFLVM